MFGPKRTAPRPAFDIGRFAADPQQLQIAKAITASGKPLDEASLLEYVASNGDKLAVVQNMLAAARAPAKGQSQLDLRAGLVSAKTSLSPELEREKARILEVVGQRIIGQPVVKEQVERIIDSFMRRKGDGKPFKMGMAGPPGVGKTELFKALGLALHGDPDAFIYIDCSKIKSSADISSIFGSSPGLVGSDKTSEISPFSKQNIQKKFKGKQPILVLLDEVDKIGGGKQDVINEFVNNFGRLLQDGEGELANQEKIDIRNSIIGLTSNSGVSTAGGLEGEALRKHYVDAFRDSVPDHINSRVPNVFGFDPHDAKTLGAVAGKVLGDVAKKVEAEVRATTGREVKVGVSPALLDFAGELGLHPTAGARPMVEWLEFLVEPHLSAIAEAAVDGERWQLELAPMSSAERTTWVQRFRAADGAVPPGVSLDSFPVAYRCVNPKLELFDYEGTLPFDAASPSLMIAGSGTAGGQPYMLWRDGDDTQMSVLRPGISEAEDKWITVALPPELAKANSDLKAVSIDPDHLLFFAVDTPLDGDQAKAMAYLYDATKKGDRFEAVPPPEVPLVGAALGGGQGKAVLWGGRFQYKEGEDWTVTPDPGRMSGRPIENQALVFDLAKKKWSFAEGGPSFGRVGAATVTKGDTVYIIGGEELQRVHHNGLLVSQSSREVTTFDLKSGRFGKGPKLPEGLAFSTAFLNPAGDVQLMGGTSYKSSGRELVEASASLVLGEHGWRGEQKDVTGYCLAAVPRSEQGWIMGPFRDPETEQLGFATLKPRLPTE